MQHLFFNEYPLSSQIRVTFFISFDARMFQMTSSTYAIDYSGNARKRKHHQPDNPSDFMTTAMQSTVDSKILADLSVLADKMDLCDSMLRPGGGDPAPSVRRDEAILSVIGFLEACSPRMVELVQAAAIGALSEHVLMQCLEVNDRLTRTLADIDTVALTETPASTTAASVPPKDPYEDLLFADDSTNNDEPEIAVGVKSTGESSELFDDDAVPTFTKSEDAFDSFFNERTNGGN
jgi:hypothetical protein